MLYDYTIYCYVSSEQETSGPQRGERVVRKREREREKSSLFIYAQKMVISHLIQTHSILTSSLNPRDIVAAYLGTASDAEAL